MVSTVKGQNLVREINAHTVLDIILILSLLPVPLNSGRVLLLHVLLGAHVVDVRNVALATLEHGGRQLCQVRDLAVIAKAVLLGTLWQPPLLKVMKMTLTKKGERFSQQDNTLYKFRLRLTNISQNFDIVPLCS